MRAIITVLGQDRVGIIAAVTAHLAEKNINVLDINQTILSGFFTMVMLVDTQQATLPFGQLAELLEQEGERLGLSIHAQREDTFHAMHKI